MAIVDPGILAQTANIQLTGSPYATNVQPLDITPLVQLEQLEMNREQLEFQKSQAEEMAKRREQLDRDKQLAKSLAYTDKITGIKVPPKYNQLMEEKYQQYGIDKLLDPNNPDFDVREAARAYYDIIRDPEVQGWVQQQKQIEGILSKAETAKYSRNQKHIVDAVIDWQTADPSENIPLPDLGQFETVDWQSDFQKMIKEQAMRGDVEAIPQFIDQFFDNPAVQAQIEFDKHRPGSMGVEETKEYYKSLFEDYGKDSGESPEGLKNMLQMFDGIETDPNVVKDFYETSLKDPIKAASKVIIRHGDNPNYVEKVVDTQAMSNPDWSPEINWSIGDKKYSLEDIEQIRRDMEDDTRSWWGWGSDKTPTTEEEKELEKLYTKISNSFSGDPEVSDILKPGYYMAVNDIGEVWLRGQAKESVDGTNPEMAIKLGKENILINSPSYNGRRTSGVVPQSVSDRDGGGSNSAPSVNSVVGETIDKVTPLEGIDSNGGSQSLSIPTVSKRPEGKKSSSWYTGNFFNIKGKKGNVPTMSNHADNIEDGWEHRVFKNPEEGWKAGMDDISVKIKNSTNKTLPEIRSKFVTGEEDKDFNINDLESTFKDWGLLSEINNKLGDKNIKNATLKELKKAGVTDKMIQMAFLKAENGEVYNAAMNGFASTMGDRKYRILSADEGSLATLPSNIKVDGLNKLQPDAAESLEQVRVNLGWDEISLAGAARTPKRQWELMQEGKTSGVGPFSSMHESGLAIDVNKKQLSKERWEALKKELNAAGWEQTYKGDDADSVEDDNHFVYKGDISTTQGNLSKAEQGFSDLFNTQDSVLLKNF